MKRLFIQALLLLALPAAGFAQSAPIKKIMETARDDNRAMQHLDILCNRFGGRPVGSDAYENAAEWAMRRFREWGYDVEAEKVGEMSVGFNRAGWWGRMTGEENMTLHFATPSYTSGTRGLQRGHAVIEPRTREEFTRMKGTLRGAWVLIDSKSRGFALPHGKSATQHRHEILDHNEQAEKHNREHAGEDGDKMEILDAAAALYDEMIEAGALGFIRPAAVPITALYDVEVVRQRIPFDSLPATPDILLDEDQYGRIQRLVKERRRVELEFDIRNHFKIGPVPYHNIVATMKGAKHPDEYVVVGAHLDAFDVATGGVDCGSGVAAVMEAARMIALSGAKPDRTIIFILFAGEEFGLWGSQAWIRDHADKLPRISNMFNRDGGPMPYTAFSAPASLVKAYDKAAEPIRALYPDYGFEVTELTPREQPAHLGGNDATSFAVKGVPTLQMNEWRDVKGHNFSYGEIWHTERDRYDKSIPEYQEQAAAALAIMILATADMPVQLPRDEIYKSEQ